MHGLFSLLGIGAWKPILAALVLPPVPFLLLTLVGARLMLSRRGWGWCLILLSVLGLWLSTCSAVGEFLSRSVLRPPPALSAARIAELKSLPRHEREAIAIVVLGGGVEARAPEYGMSNLHPMSMERLRYGLWLGHESGLPLAFTGGVGWVQADSETEADVAARIAAQEFGRPLRWVENQARDTRENAIYSIGLLKKDGIRHILLVTHAEHMPRAMKMFEEAAASEVRIEAAPMGLATANSASIHAWLPSSRGFVKVQSSLHEWLGLLAGA